VYFAKKTVDSTVSASHLMNAIRVCSEHTYEENRLAAVHEVMSDIRSLIAEAAKESKHIGALKILRNPTPKAKDRMQREVEAVIQAHDEIGDNLALVRILEANVAENWFVMEYFGRGTLSGHLGRYRGDPLGALQAFRSIVSTVAAIHRRGYVHRDIKPDNIFVDGDDHLVLGDFGLVIHNATDNERLTDTLENVGSRDWMPAWASGARIEEIRPTFDVFSLGKVLWAMVSGKPFLRLWYFNDPEFDIEIMFPNAKELRWITSILERTVVQHEANCLKDANELLTQVDEVIDALRHGGQTLRRNDMAIRCVVCRTGRGYGEFPGSGETLAIICTNCGHVHRFDQAKTREGWK
jgi:serine/threonine protein kinase